MASREEMLKAAKEVKAAYRCGRASCSEAVSGHELCWSDEWLGFFCKECLDYAGKEVGISFAEFMRLSTLIVD